MKRDKKSRKHALKVKQKNKLTLNDIPRNNGSIYNNHYQVTIKYADGEVENHINLEDGEKIMLERISDENLKRLRGDLNQLIQDENIGEDEFLNKATELLNSLFKIPNISTPYQYNEIKIPRGTILYRVCHDDNLEFEFGRESSDVLFPGRLNEKYEQSLYLSFKEEVALNEAKGWISKSDSKNYYITRYEIQKEIEILSLNSADFQDFVFSPNDSKIALKLSNFKNSFLKQKSPTSHQEEIKFYHLTNLLKNEKHLPSEFSGLVFVSSLMQDNEFDFNKKSDGYSINRNDNIVLYNSTEQKLSEIIKRIYVSEPIKF